MIHHCRHIHLMIIRTALRSSGKTISHDDDDQRHKWTKNGYRTDIQSL